MAKVDTCYLCNQPVRDDSRSRDHVPPLQLFAPSIRKRFNPHKLTTLPAHKSCNQDFGRDEEYFAHSLAAVAVGSPTADALVRHHGDRLWSGRAVGLVNKVIESFEDRPSGLSLPERKLVLRVEGDRIRRVAWKIVRGLFRLEHGAHLPEVTRHRIELREPENTGPSLLDDVWETVKAEESKGLYQAVFAYKHLWVANERSHRIRCLWGMLLWNRLMIFIAHE